MASICACSSSRLCALGSYHSYYRKSLPYLRSLYFNSKLARSGNALAPKAFYRRDVGAIYAGLFRIRVHMRYFLEKRVFDGPV